MSYFGQDSNPNINADRAFGQTFMPADLLALDRIYSPQGFGSRNAFAGDTVYGFNTNISREKSLVWHEFANVLQEQIPAYRARAAYTIADGSGRNSLNLSQFSGDQRIDLRPTDPSRSTLYASDILGGRGNLLIAAGTTIRDAIGGGGNDIFFGNAADNSFWGGGGNDLFWDSPGNNVYRGGAGDGDRVYFFRGLSDFYYDLSSGGVNLGCIATGDVKTVFNCVEWFHFGSQRIGDRTSFSNVLSYADIVGLASSAGPKAPQLVLRAGAKPLGAERITNNNILSVSGLLSGAAWQYSIDAGLNWLLGSGSSLALNDGSYRDGQVQVRQILNGALSPAAASFAAFTIKTTAPEPRIAGVGRRNQVNAAGNRRQIRGLGVDPFTKVEIVSGSSVLGVTSSNSKGLFSYTLTPENIKKLGQGGRKSVLAVQVDAAGNTGRSSSPLFRINTTRGSKQRDLLTGEAKRRDTFLWGSLDQTPLKRYDTITNYESRDRLRIQGKRYRTKLNSLEGRARRLNANQINRVLGRRDFTADGAAAFQVRGMDGTFIALNNGRSGFQANRDGLIFLEGFDMRRNNPAQIL
jgi:hypothetical protein